MSENTISGYASLVDKVGFRRRSMEVYPMKLPAIQHLRLSMDGRRYRK